MSKNKFAAVLVSGALAVGTTACGQQQDEAPTGETGSVNFATTAQALAANEMVTVAIDCNQDTSGRAYSNVYKLPVDSRDDLGAVKARFNSLPTGFCDFVVRAFETSDTTQPPTFEGSKLNVPIAQGDNGTLLIVLQEQGTSPSDPFSNSAPYITSLLVSSTAVGPGQQVFLEASADDDDDGDTLTYSWSSTGGTIDDVSDPAIYWDAPSTDYLAAYTLTIKVSDAMGAMASFSIDIDVGPQYATGEASLDFQLKFNRGPAVTGIAVMQDEEAVGPDGEVAVHILTAVVVDSDGQATSKEWSVPGGCGQFLVIGNEGPAWASTAAGDTVRFMTDDADGCLVVVTATEVRDDLTTPATGVGTIKLWPIDVELLREPEFVGAFQSRETASRGQQVHLSVDIILPDSDEFAEVVGVSTNGTGTVVLTGDSPIDPNRPDLGIRLTAVWTAPPACFASEAEITVDVTSPANGDVWGTFTFFVTSADPCP